MDYISNYLNNWLLGLSTTTPRVPDVTTSSASGGGGGGGWSGGMRPPLVPGGHGVWINADSEDKEDDSDGGSGMSGQRRGGLVSRDGYLDYVRRQEERRNYRGQGEYSYWG